MANSVEQHLDRVFSNAANENSAFWKGKKAKITLLDRDYRPTETFTGEVLSVCYDKQNDCDVYTVKRDSDGKTFSKLTFFIEVEETEG